MKNLILANAFVILTSFSANAQKFSSIIHHKEPLSLKSIGSFYVGGNREFQSTEQLGGICPEGYVSINQMYVKYMVPLKKASNLNIVLIHGGHLTGKGWETTPDGRMGWDEYFVRNGFSTFVIDQVGQGRSGFNQKKYNAVKLEGLPVKDQGTFSRKSDENAWMNFRFGIENHQPVQDAQFPVEAEMEFSKQSVPHFFDLPTPNPNFKNLSELATDIQNTVLVSHSQSGSFPLQTILYNSAGINAVVMLEPGGTGSDINTEQIKKLAKIPVLIIFGDNLKNETGLPGHLWQNSFNGWKNFTEKIKKAGGSAKMIYLPDLGIRGNSHMMMMDKNNLQIANMIINWLANLR